MAWSRRDFLAAAATATALSSLPASGWARPLASALPGDEPLADAPLPDTRWLMPAPAVRQFPGGRLALTPDFSVGFGGIRNRRLEAAVERFLARLNGRTGLAFDTLDPTDAPAATATLVLDCRANGRDIPQLGDDESYTLDVAAGRVRLQANETVGALRGLETLSQLIEGDARGSYLPLAHIEDRPRFAWRGLLLDVSRHWEPVEVVRRTLDGMAAVKLNVFHWHLTDDQGFRVQCRRYPKLTGMGSDGNFYTQRQVREIIAYAADRGIRVLPEFDMPAHSTSWLVGYPELGSKPGPFSIERHFGVFENVFDPADPAVYRFLDGFLGEMAGLFPDDYIHIGGDENPAHQWTNNPSIQAFMRAHGLADNHALQAYFNRRIAPILTRHGKKMMGWEEILNPALPDTIAVEAWLGIPAVNKIAQAGHDALLAAGYYLDLMGPASESYAVDPIPADTPLTTAEQKHVLGGEACMWGERVDPATVDSRVWPRTAAIAERFWSPREITDADDMYRRLERVSLDLEALGLLHRTNQDRILRWLAGGEDTAPLATLVEAVEPRKGYGWSHSKSVFVPMVFFVNATPPESPLRRRLPAAAAGGGERAAGRPAALCGSARRSRGALCPLAGGRGGHRGVERPLAAARRDPPARRHAAPVGRPRRPGARLFGGRRSGAGSLENFATGGPEASPRHARRPAVYRALATRRPRQRLLTRRLRGSHAGVIVAIDRIAEGIASEALSDETFRRSLRELLRARSQKLLNQLMSDGPGSRRVARRCR